MTRNKLKKSTEPAPKEPKANKSSSPKFNFITKFNTKISNILLNEKVVKITGLIFLVSSVFLLLALSAYLFTWKIDQDKLNHTWNEILFNPEIQVENWLGKLGALVSHQLIFSGFGISSFIIPFLIFLIGFKILFKTNLLPLSKSFRYALFSMLWLSLAFGYVFSKISILGGAFGYETNIWVSSVIGNIGVGLILFLSLLIFLVFNFNISFDIFPKREEKEEIEPLNENAISPVLETEDEELIDEELNNIENEDIEPILKSEVQKEDEFEEITEPEETESIDLDSTPPPETKSDDIEFSVEETDDEDDVLSESELNKKVAEFGEYDPTLDLSSYQLPSIDLLKDFGNTQKRVTPEELEANKNRILETLGNYNIKIASIKATIGPTVTLYEIVPEAGVRISKIKNLEDDIALSLAALGIRIIAPIPGKGTIGIEVPNQNPEIVPMRNVIASDKFQNAKMELPVVMGKTITNETFVFDLAKMPHLLMAGATGQGKSVGLNAVLTSLLYKKHPAQLKFVLVDPKKVELTLYNKIERHFLAKLPDSEDAIITDNQKVINTLNSLCIEMDQRYDLLKNAMVRNIVEYNAKFIARKLNPNDGHKYLPYIVLVIDEFADLIMTAGKEVETPIARLAQLARAIGIHLIIATQRPSANIITGIIKANFPGRIAFRVTSGIDSRTILDSSGADQLIGKGDMLFSQGNDLVRVQCAFVDTPEVERICEFIGNQRGYPEVFTLPEYVGESATGGTGTFDDDDKDDLFDDAARMLVQHQQGSASLLQRKMKIGYNRAGRIIDQMEAAGIIGPFEGSKARQVLITDLDTLEQFLKDMNQQ
jgi:S-DNA-T family DNA segregation ATPase FtsK/SpoIIIE